MQTKAYLFWKKWVMGLFVRSVCMRNARASTGYLKKLAKNPHCAAVRLNTIDAFP
jgi:hypothetical protein